MLITCCFGKDFNLSKFAFEIEHEITPMEQMKAINFSLEKDDCTSKVLIYNPDKWKYVEYYFYKDRPIKKLLEKFIQFCICHNKICFEILNT
ncbi:TPA: DUF4865 family protein [Clostridioides difficile]|uniref:DUF4865 family protein n=2 Tax=Clostridioides difficile TaxID=1496 RepID=UPI00017F600D|nr:DUF4865 family protein [Clostridioides difficile]EQE41591.1 hypothetical protein QCC_3333 [Clostridioides difficile CD41]EQE72422.1 hypothetical protein QCK_3945 [Clostridioides difficile CD45]EQE91278.1 hypothetical protein QE9_2250 [Clostridioides difficile CD104]EQF65511.1 hypothetical protein QGK_3362 [Clostridioides difficile CD206]EQF68538.1 hypothetical protein QGG_2213 [Clostridioides difficile CD201]CCL82078.1 hypothetical protein BN187_3330002 [Clostridioides difficile E12]CCL93